MESFNLKKVNDVKVKETYQVKISNRFAAMENVCCCCYNNDNNIKASATETQRVET
jgi:hypothetical protein